MGTCDFALLVGSGSGDERPRETAAYWWDNAGLNWGITNPLYFNLGMILSCGRIRSWPRAQIVFKCLDHLLGLFESGLIIFNIWVGSVYWV